MSSKHQFFSPEKQIIAQQWVGIVCAIAMTYGFLFSRALLSVATIVLFVNAFMPANFKNIWKQYTTNRFALLSTSYFILYVVSFLWSQDTAAWWRYSVFKIPFIVLPFSMWSVPLRYKKFKLIYLISMLGVVTLLMLYSILIFILHHQSFINDYTYVEMIPTTRYNDHIRFGVWLSVCIIMIVELLRSEYYYWQNKRWRYFLLSIVMVIIIYLHLLSAKTSLVTLYITLLGLGIYLLSLKWGKLKAVVISIVAMCTIISTFYIASPTFRSKITYTLYEVQLIKSGTHLDYNFTDMGRLITYQIALKQMPTMPLLGYSAGGVIGVMDKGYNAMYPNVPSNERYVPINQYLVEVMSFGWVLSLVFVIMILIPLFVRGNQKRIYLVLTTLCLLFSLFTEAMLELQMGVFVYLFLTMYWYNILASTKEC